MYLSCTKTCKHLTIQQCKAANFGQVSFNQEQLTMLSLMNSQIVALCRALPSPLRDSAILTIQLYYTDFGLSNLLNFFTKFYVPSWSIIYWMQQAHPVLSPDELESAFCAQAIAYFLHMLDNHLADGQIPTSHLLLQLRTQAWIKFTQKTATLAQYISDGEALVQELIDIYFSGIHCPPNVDGLDAYSDLFRKQLCTTLVVPMLVAHRTRCNANEIRQAYEFFGLAWRLLDDLRDCTIDATSGRMSSLYYFLSPQLRELWLLCRGKDEASPEWKELQLHLEKEGILADFIFQILVKLEEAQNVAQTAGLDGYAVQLCQLARPLKELLTPQ